ncbi:MULTISPECIES: deoxyribodipyrimidine photo-lyase [unclassified Legionella]|uniref:cryptochrome/photolyase family protein n=1 Tax=unclassified Legionella TaxID=2622702 RepID=UPI00105634BB|nr:MULTISPECIES: deoxyribodipyrimidine photo-lyase [unclassified Legionella]MDI9819430.1 deoxyribodipyrimidine photo-lyase [Legionella sp. PL877]
MSIAIVWFRQDLRCQDNPALAIACQNHDMIIPLYIADDPPKKTVGEAQCWWLHHSLSALQQELQKHGLSLCLRRGSPLSHLLSFIEEYPVKAIYWNRCYEPDAIARDKLIKKELKTRGLDVTSFNGSLLNEPWDIQTQDNHYYKVFTPYWRQCLKQMNVPAPLAINQWPRCPDFHSETLEYWRLLPAEPDWAENFSSIWQPGEKGAIKKLNYFLTNHLHEYKTLRDKPSSSATSRLSPHLHFGEISPRQIWRAVEQEIAGGNCHLPSAECFLSELGWREFSYHLLYHYPQLPSENFRSEFNAFTWREDKQALKAWQQGLTGYPIIDAGMRELWHTGYMHNRVRMIVASFLVKDLLIDWRRGANWFWNTLLDADLANNSASWQWVAGSGADAAPYFRVFNPTLQGKKFDAEGDYIRRWVPELATVPNQWIHMPWEAPKHALSITLGKDYPFPIVDHSTARKRALAYYQSIKQ